MAKNRKRKVSFGNVLFIVLIVAMLLVLTYFGVVYVKDKVTSTTKNNNDTTEVENDTNNNEVNSKVASMSLVDYEVFKDDAEELGFNFVIAKVKFTTSANNLYVNLADMQTSEKIYCDQMGSYISTLDKFNYDLSNYDLVDSYIKSDSNETMATILIPYTKTKGELKVYCNGDILKFDLTKAVPAESLIRGNIPQDQIINDKDTNKSLTVSRAYVSDLMQKDGEPLQMSATSYIYTFNIKVNEVENGVTVKDAKFIKKGSTYENDALEEEISSFEIDNIIGKELKVGDTYALFFNIIKNGDAPIDYDGILKIQFSDSDKWLEVTTEIN